MVRENLKTLGNISQGCASKNPSQTFNVKKENVLLRSVKKNLAFFFYSSKSPVKDFVSKKSSKEFKILLAVSGGVDSQVMLHSLHSLLQSFNFSLSVVTVNHNIRDFDESKKDADLVYNYCTTFLDLPCKIITIEPKKIEKLQMQRGRGIEEAARFERYTTIEKYAKSIQADVVFFAHNKDDQLETLLQHFLQGASAGISGFASSGIRQCSKYPSLDSSGKSQQNLYLFRPLLSVSRKNIEDYAHLFDVPFREDSTNAEITYFRNKIRHKLIPVLQEYFTGWDTGILNGSEKALQEALFIENLASKISWTVKEDVRMKVSDFLSQGFPVRVRLLYEGIELAGFDGKIPYDIIRCAAEGRKRAEGLGLEIYHKNNYIIIRKIQAAQPNFDILINALGGYKTEFGTFDVKPAVEKCVTSADTERGHYYVGAFCLPMRIRSKISGDTILSAQGTHKSVKKIFSEWRVDIRHRTIVPIIESEGSLKCILGLPYGYKNWYVKQNKAEQEQVSVWFTRND